MALNTVIQQGKFTSNGGAKVLQLRSDIDWMMVYNFTEASATNDVGCQFYWQRGMDDDDGLYYFKSGGGNALNMDNLGTGGVSLQDTSSAVWGAATAITSSTDATQPSFTVASTAALSTGDVVRVYGISGQTNLNGLEFEIEVVDGTHFRPNYALATTPGVAGTGGNYQVRQHDEPYQPERTFIFQMSAAANAVLTLSQAHVYEADDFVRLSFKGAAWGNHEQADGVSAKILSATASTITLDYDSTALGALAYPLPAAVPYSFAEVFPYGSLRANNTDAGRDAGFIAMQLAGGSDAPGGANGDVMYWVAGKSLSNLAE